MLLEEMAASVHSSHGIILSKKKSNTLQGIKFGIIEQSDGQQFFGP